MQGLILWWYWEYIKWPRVHIVYKTFGHMNPTYRRSEVRTCIGCFILFNFFVSKIAHRVLPKVSIIKVTILLRPFQEVILKFADARYLNEFYHFQILTLG